MTDVQLLLLCMIILITPHLKAFNAFVIGAALLVSAIYINWVYA